MNGNERDDLLWSAIESGTLDAAVAADTEIAGRFAAHQKLESLFAMLCEPSTSDDPLDQPSQIGRYRVDSTLGEGAFGKVYLAHDPELNRSVAIKVPRANVFSSERDADRFLEEAKLAASLNHPGIVTIHDAGRETRSCFIVMEYVKGRSLEQIMLDTKFSAAETVNLVAEIADALHHAHTRGFVHRDLKPGNVLVDSKRQPHVADFGLAVSERSQLQKVGQIAGTPAYMSPEQIRGETHRLDGRTDIWSLGIILYELLTGRHPFLQTGSEDCSDEILHREPKPPRQINDGIPRHLEEICLRCLSKDVSQRYSTAADVAASLRTPCDLDSSALLAHSSATRRRYAVSFSLGAIAIAVVIGIGILLSRSPIDGGGEKSPPSESKTPFDSQFLGAHPRIADLLGFLYDEELEGSSPAAWIQVETRGDSGSTRPWRALANGSRLSSDDRYRILLRAPENTHFYVFQIDSRGQIDWAFPKNSVSAHSTGSNPAPANTTVKVPEGEGAMFFLDERTGVEHLYAVATRLRWNALESKLAELSSDQEHNVADALRVDAPIDLKLRGIGGIASDDDTGESLDTGIQGVLAKETWFHHVEPNADKKH